MLHAYAGPMGLLSFGFGATGVAIGHSQNLLNAIEVAQNNFNSWNRHDADAIVAAFAEGGPIITPTALTSL